MQYSWQIGRDYQYNWQYNGIATWDEIIDWCWTAFDDNQFTTNHLEIIYFKREEDYAMFLLRWGA